jgi:activator of HSP90 ATPase
MKTESVVDSTAMTTRRQMMTGIAIAVLGITAASQAQAAFVTHATQETSPTAANAKSTSIHQEINIKTSPQRIYEALLDSKQFTSFPGASADIDRKEGGAFSMFGGLIVGRNVETIPSKRIVQAWRPTHWDEGVYSIVKFELKPGNSETLVVLDHTGFLESEFDHLAFGWNAHYWGPMKKFFA